jgi:mycothiol synthase
VVATADVRAPEPKRSCDAFVRVHPDHTRRGIGSALLDVCEGRARARAGGPTRVLTTTEPADPAGLALLRDRGYEHVRTFVHMERELHDDLEAVLPEGVAFRAFRDDDRDDWAAFHRVIESSFEDHFEAFSLELDAFIEMWTEMPTWDPTLVTFAVAGDGIAGVVVSDLLDGRGLGWVSDVGVLAPFRGRGIGRALLLHAFGDLRERGCDRVRLNVDLENTTGATRLYERAGMHVHREWLVHEKALEADD